MTSTPQTRGTLAALSDDLASAVERAGRAVVAIYARPRIPASGVLWRPNVVVAADHTIRREEGITVALADGRRVAATLAGRDPGTDLAVLKLDDDAGAGTPAELGGDDTLKAGHIVLALGRRSKMPIVKMLCVIFIEAVRGIPLITVLFMASVMLPLFLPPGVTFDKYLRALIGVSLFAAAYMAEVVRGGLQAIPKGQYEGADSLGLGYWQKMYFIVMPQALKLVIPGIVNTFIGMFKDTSLVTIISMFDLLGIVKQNFSDANWATAQTAKSGLIFAAFVFWLFCFGMSRYSMYTERRLDTGHKR